MQFQIALNFCSYVPVVSPGCGNDFDCVSNDSGDDWFDANSDIDCDSCSCNDENSVNSTTGNVVTDPDA